MSSKHNPYSGLLRRYAPAAGMNGALLDYFAEPPVIVLLDIEALRSAFAQLAEKMEHVAAHPVDEFPFLDLHSYVHEIDYYERFGCRRYGCGRPRRMRGGSYGFIPRRTRPFSASSTRSRGFSSSSGSGRWRRSSTPRARAQCERLADLLEEHEHLAHLPVGWLTSGFVWEEAGMAVLTDHEIFHRMLPRPARRARRKRVSRAGHDQPLQAADFVVHVDFGIGRFMGLEKVTAGGNETECLCIRYEGGDLIYVPRRADVSRGEIRGQGRDRARDRQTRKQQVAENEGEDSKGPGGSGARAPGGVRRARIGGPDSRSRAIPPGRRLSKRRFRMRKRLISCRRPRLSSGTWSRTGRWTG